MYCGETREPIEFTFGMVFPASNVSPTVEPNLAPLRAVMKQNILAFNGNQLVDFEQSRPLTSLDPLKHCIRLMGSSRLGGSVFVLRPQTVPKI